MPIDTQTPPMNPNEYDTTIRYQCPYCDMVATIEEGDDTICTYCERELDEDDRLR